MSPSTKIADRRMAHHITPEIIADLVDAGLAIARAERLGGRGRVPIEVTKIRISGAGRKALA